jgi:hypothetical protein
MIPGQIIELLRKSFGRLTPTGETGVEPGLLETVSRTNRQEPGWLCDGNSHDKQ